MSQQQTITSTGQMASNQDLPRAIWVSPELEEASVSATAAKSPDFTEATFEKNGS